CYSVRGPPQRGNDARKRYNVLDQIRRLDQRLLCEVGVPLRRPRMQMPKKALYDVERHASIDKEARKRVAQVVQADIRENCALANSHPAKRQRGHITTHTF